MYAAITSDDDNEADGTFSRDLSLILEDVHYSYPLLRDIHGRFPEHRLGKYRADRVVYGEVVERDGSAVRPFEHRVGIELTYLLNAHGLLLVRAVHDDS